MLNYFWRENENQFLIFAHSGEFTKESILKSGISTYEKAWELYWLDDLKYCDICGSGEINAHSEYERECMGCGNKFDVSDRNTRVRRFHPMIKKGVLR